MNGETNSLMDAGLADGQPAADPAAQSFVDEAADFWKRHVAEVSAPSTEEQQATDFWNTAKQKPADALKQSVSYGATQNPDEYAKSVRLGQQMGVSPDVAKDHQDILAPAAATNRMDYLKFMEAAPKTAAWATDPTNAAVSGVDELHRVGAIEQQDNWWLSEGKSAAGYMNAAIAGTVLPLVNALGVGVQATGETIGTVLGQIFKGQTWKTASQMPLMDVARALFNQPGAEGVKATLDQAATGDIASLKQHLWNIWGAERHWDIQGVTDPIRDWMTQGMIAGPPQYIIDPKTKEPKLNPDYRWYGRPLVGAVEAMPAQLAIFALTGKLGGLTEEGLGAAGAGLESKLVPSILGTQAAQNTYAEARAKGADQKTAILSSLYSGGINWMMMGAMPGPVPTSGLGGAIGQWATRSAAMGAVNQIALNAAARMYDPNRSLFEGVPESMTTFGAFEAIGAFSHMVDLAADSKLKARSPEKFQEALGKIFEGQESLRIPVEQFETYFQSQNLDPARVATALGVDNYAEAKASGEVQISKPDYLTKLDPAHQKALLPDIIDPVTNRTIRQQATALKEMNDFLAGEGPEQLRNEMAQAIETHAQQTQATPEYQQVKEELKKRFMAAGESEAVAETYATAEANVHAYLARETGMQPTEVLALMNPRIRIGEAPTGAMAQGAVSENFGTTGGSKETGISGSYPLHFEAIRRAAKERGILPREMQSITWEAIRGLFSSEFKSDKENKALVDDIWRQVDRNALTPAEFAELADIRMQAENGALTNEEKAAIAAIRAGKDTLSEADLKKIDKIWKQVRKEVSDGERKRLSKEDAQKQTDRIWNRAEREKRPALSVDAAREQIYKLAGGMDAPPWWSEAEKESVLRDKTYEQKRPAFSGRKITFEVAPDPNNAALVARWRQLAPEQRWAISRRIGWDIAGRTMAAFGEKAELHAQLGGYLDDTNPSLSLWLDETTSASKMVDIARVLGYALDQDQMMVTSPRKFKGGSNFGIVVIRDVDDAKTAEIYNDIRANVVADDGKPLINGHTTADGRMAILVDADKAADIAKQVAAHLGDAHDVYDDTLQAAWPKKGKDGYGLSGTQTGTAGEGGPESPLRPLADQLRGEASSRIEEHIQRAEGGETFFQSGEQRPEQPRGWITVHPDGSVEIGKTARGDISTLPHEFAHAYMKVLEILSQRPGASEVIKGDYQKILDFLGAKAGEPLTVEQQEKFARAREQYLREGKAPTKSLRGTFQRFAVWLSSIYKKASELGVELTPEMREVFARMHAGDEAVNHAEAESGPRQFDNAEQAGWTEEQFAKYAASRGMEVDEAKTEILGKLNAAALRERTEYWQEEQDAVRKAKTDEIDARPEYQALRALRKGEIEPTTEGEEPTPLTLNKDELVKQFGEERVAALQRQHRGIYRLEGGVDAQTAAEMLGYSSGDELIQALESAPKRDQAIEQETRQYMTDKHGDIRYDGSLEDQARLARENQTKAENLHKELKALERKLDPRAQLRDAQRQLAAEERAAAEDAKQEKRIEKRDQKIADLKQEISDLKESIRTGKQERRAGARLAMAIPPLEAFRQAAHDMVESKAVVDLTPARYLEASRKFAREAYQALAKGDYEGARAAKQQELMNHFLYREASAAKDFIAGFEAYTKRAQGKPFQQSLGKAGGDYRTQFNNLMARYGLMAGQGGATGLEAFVQAQHDMFKEPAIDPSLFDETRQLNYKNAPISEVRAVNDALKNIRKLANQELRMIVNGRLVEFENAVQAMAARARASNKVTPERVLQRNATVRERGVNLVDWGDATILPAERLIDFLDGGKRGPWHDYLWNLAADSQGAEEAMNAEVTRKVQEVFERMPKEQRDRMMEQVSVPGIDETVTRHELISMALNMGNEGNLGRLQKTFKHHGWDPDVINQLKTGLLSREDWQFVQGIWNVLEEFGKKSFAFEERMNGIPPVKVAPDPFEVTLADGSTMHMDGGYFPVHMDPRFSHAGARQDASTTAQGLVQPGYTRATTSRGFLKERTGYGGPLLFDYEQTLTQHLVKMVKDITHREFALTANKLLMHPTVRSAMRETMGGKYEEQMLPWLQTIINNRNGSANQGLGLVSAGIRELRKNIVIASLGFKASTNILQVLHAPRMMLYTRPDRYLQALGDFIVRPRDFMAEVRALSPNEMAGRGMHGDRDTREMIEAMSGQKGWTSFAGVRDRAVKAGMMTFKYIDMMMSFPLWMSVYRQARVENAQLPDAESKYQSMQAADRAVRLGLGAHSPKDLAPIMRNNDVTKLITVLYGFHSGVYGQLRSMGHELRYDGVKGIPKFTYGMLMAAIVPSVLSNLVRGKQPDKDESVGEWAAKGSLMYSFETIPVLRDVLSAIEFHKDVKISPLVDLLDKAVRIGIEAEGKKGKQRDYTGLGLDSLELGGNVIGVPGTAQIIKPLRYYHHVAQHKITHPNLYDAFIGSGATKKH